MAKRSTISTGKDRSDLKGITADFPIFSKKISGRPIHYLDNAATSQKPLAVIEAEEGYYKEYCANIHRGVYSFSEEATDKYEHARETIARFICAKPSEIVFTRGTTESINMVAYAWGKKGIRKNGKIAITEMEHHANIVPWQIAGEGKKANISAIPIDTETLSLDMENANGIIKDSDIFSFTHVSNAIGRINDARALTGMAHDLGVPVCIDAAQSVAHMALDVKKIGCDFLAFSGHKMLGPTGIGVLYVSEEWGEKMPPFMGGGDMIREVGMQKSTFAPAPQKFEAGTMPIAQAIGLGVAAKYLKSHEKYIENDNKLATLLQTKLENTGARVYRSKNCAGFAPIVTFTYPNMHPHDIASILNRRNVMVRSGHHCAMPLHKKLGVPATCRASFHMYNSKEDIYELLKGIEDAKKIFM